MASSLSLSLSLALSPVHFALVVALLSRPLLHPPSSPLSPPGIRSFALPKPPCHPQIYNATPLPLSTPPNRWPVSSSALLANPPRQTFPPFTSRLHPLSPPSSPLVIVYAVCWPLLHPLAALRCPRRRPCSSSATRVHSDNPVRAPIPPSKHLQPPSTTSILPAAPSGVFWSASAALRAARRHATETQNALILLRCVA